MPPIKKHPTERSKTFQPQASLCGIWQDERFRHLIGDPRFKGIPKEQRKIKIDNRFQGMFTADKFQVKYTVDKYGRRINKTNVGDLKKYYEVDSTSEDDEKEEQDRYKEKQVLSCEDETKNLEYFEKVGVTDKLVSDDEEVPVSIKERLLNPNIDYARGEGRLVTESSSDDVSSSEEDSELYIGHVWGELDVEADTTDESTRRLAVCNMDWDRIRAVDLFMLFTSFLPLGGSILSVKIYPSEFGKERMAQEEKHGPIELVGLNKDGISNASKSQTITDVLEFEKNSSAVKLVEEQNSDAEEGDEYNMEKLRQYQLHRLRYYYAVVECDSVQAADKIYKECDGIEYESSATRVDLRFVPDVTSFKEDKPSDVCTELPDINSYKPRQFTTTALQQRKVDLTWDETAVERLEIESKLSTGKLNEVSDSDLRKIVAYSSEEDDDEEEGQEQKVRNKSRRDIQIISKAKSSTLIKGKMKNGDKISKYKALLEEIIEEEQKEKNQKIEMEFSWDINESKAENRKNVHNAKAKSSQELTPIDKMLLKRSEKNKKRKKEHKKRKMQVHGINGVDLNSDSESIADGIDLNVPYFAEEFAAGDFINPKTWNKKKTKKQTQGFIKNVQEEEKKQSKELQLLLDDDNMIDPGKQHFSLEKIIKSQQETKLKTKRLKQFKRSDVTNDEYKNKIEDNFEVNVNDDRFNAIYSSHLFNIDPSDSHFKKTKAMDKIIYEKLKRRLVSERDNKQNIKVTPGVESKRPKMQLENILLVKSLKGKINLKQRK